MLLLGILERRVKLMVRARRLLTMFVILLIINAKSKQMGQKLVVALVLPLMMPNVQPMPPAAQTHVPVVQDIQRRQAAYAQSLEKCAPRTTTAVAKSLTLIVPLEAHVAKDYALVQLATLEKFVPHLLTTRRVMQQKIYVELAWRVLTQNAHVALLAGTVMSLPVLRRKLLVEPVLMSILIAPSLVGGLTTGRVQAALALVQLTILKTEQHGPAANLMPENRLVPAETVLKPLWSRLLPILLNRHQRAHLAHVVAGLENRNTSHIVEQLHARNTVSLMQLREPR